MILWLFTAFQGRNLVKSVEFNILYNLIQEVDRFNLPHTVQQEFAKVIENISQCFTFVAVSNSLNRWTEMEEVSIEFLSTGKFIIWREICERNGFVIQW